MRFRRSRFGPRQAALSASAFGIGVALLILWLGYRHDLEIDRLVAEGQLAEGEYIDTHYGSRADGSADRARFRFTVKGVKYWASAGGGSSSASKPLFEPELIRLPRLGPEGRSQIVYLPSDPSVSRLRDDMKKAYVTAYAAAGMFMLIGLVFGAVGLFVFPKRRRPR